MLRVENLETFYGTSQALFSMSFDVNVGEVATLLGRNGMGKTTTINSLMGIIKPHAGSITYDGVEVLGEPSFKMANLGLGLVPEGRQIFPNLSVRENLVATASNHLEMPEPWSVDRIYELFPELAQRATSMGNLLSGGEQQMLAVARALARDIKLLLLDEPYEGLAPVIVHEIERILLEIKSQGITTVIVEQNAVAALKLADRAVILDTGEVVFSGSAQAVLDDEAMRLKYLAI